MIKKTLLIAINVLLFNVTIVNASFFDLGEGARPQGMGKAFVAIADDANALFYNTAGITQIEKITGTSTYTRLYVGLPGLNDGSAAVVVPMGIIGVPGYLGVSANHFNLSDTDAASYRETLVGLSYAYRLNDIGFINDILGTHLLSLGIKVKGYNLRYGANEWTNINPVFGTNSDKTNKWGYGGDVSLFYQTPLKGLNVGASLENIPQPDMGLDSESRVPYLVRLGASWRVSEQLITAFEADYRGLNFKPKIDQVGKFNIGTEYWFTRAALDSVYISYGDIALRGGFGTGSGKYSNASFGFGYKAKVPIGIYAQLDYAFVWPFNFVEGLSGTHRVSLSIIESGPGLAPYEKPPAPKIEETTGGGVGEVVPSGEPKKETPPSQEVKPEEKKEQRTGEVVEGETKPQEKDFFQSIIDAIKFW